MRCALRGRSRSLAARSGPSGLGLRSPSGSGLRGPSGLGGPSGLRGPSGIGPGPLPPDPCPAMVSNSGCVNGFGVMSGNNKVSKSTSGGDGTGSCSDGGVTAAEVSAVVGTGPVSVSVVSESIDGDIEGLGGNNSENAVGNGSYGDGGEDRGDDSAEGVRVTSMSGVSVLSKSKTPADARVSNSAWSSSGSVGSCIRSRNSSSRLRCGRGRSRSR
jgi:hypothetical protein